MLNLPIVATVALGTATYTYDATGNKLRKVDVLSGVTTATDYIGGIQYGTTGGVTSLSFIQTEEGKAVVNGTGYDYTYYLSDNLGNTRVTFGTKTGTAVRYQRDDYYPFGLEINRSVLSPKNEYLYNKKELQEELGEYDYGSRFMDPVIGRWTSIDPHAEKYQALSSYAYVANNPLKFVDEDGKDIIIPQRDRAQVTKYINSISSGTFAINSKGHLYEVSSKGGGGKSTYYTTKLKEGIDSKTDIYITTDKSYIAHDGTKWDVNHDAGGGLTDPKEVTTTDKDGNIVNKIVSEHVVISGDANPNVEDQAGKPLHDTPADILAHELVGHAIPDITKKDTGNAVDDENKVRSQEGKGKNKKRRREPDHTE